jgi:hypothetical protein
LLHNGPVSRGSDDERVKVNLETVGYGVVIDAGSEPAGADEGIAVESAPV